MALNAPFTGNKRVLDASKLLLQQLCLFVILRYRGSRLQHWEEKKTDELRLSSADYNNHVKETYDQLKRVINHLSRLVLNATNQDVSNAMVNTYQYEHVAYQKYELCELIYGITNETNLGDSDLSWSIMDEGRTNHGVIEDNENESDYSNPTFREIRQSLNALLNRQQKKNNDSGQIGPVEGNASYNYDWFSLLKKRTYMLYSEIDPNIIQYFGKIMEIVGTDARSHNMETTTMDNSQQSTARADPTKGSFMAKMNQEFKQQSDAMSLLSIEDLKQAFEITKERRGEEIASGVVGPAGGLFADFGGYNMSLGLNDRINFEENMDSGVDPEDNGDPVLQKSNEDFKKLVEEFDLWLAETYT
jgi:hypothetical protein